MRSVLQRTPRASAARWGLVLFALWHAVACQAQVDEATAERLMRRSGLWEQLGTTAAGARAGIEAAARNHLTPLSAEEVQGLLHATDTALAPDKLRGAVRGALMSRVPAEEVPAVESWLDSELGRRITALELAASRPDRDSERVIRSGIARLEKASPERRRLVETLVEASRSAEAITAMTINIAVAVQRGVAVMRPGTPAPPVTALREAFAGQRAQMLQAYRGMSQALFAETYEGLADAELTRYLEFLRGSAGRRFLDATLQAMEQALVDAAEELGARLPGVRPGART
jgi:hypothetical protein